MGASEGAAVGAIIVFLIGMLFTAGFSAGEIHVNNELNSYGCTAYVKANQVSNIE
jgi:hypothetical protein